MMESPAADTRALEGRPSTTADFSTADTTRGGTTECGGARALLWGPLMKQSNWLGRWNSRQAALEPVRSGAIFSWHGGANSGFVALDATCVVRLDGEQLVVRSGQRVLRFRAALGGAGLDEWHAAMTAMCENHD